MNCVTTSTTLLKNLAEDSAHPRWSEFVSRYHPMMEAYLRKRFPSVEADDVIQETLIAIVKILPLYCYVPDEKGHFRNYLTGILRNKALRKIRTDKRRHDFLDTLSSDSHTETNLNCLLEDDEMQQWREAMYELALERFLSDKTIAERTKRVFVRTSVNGESPEAVAAAFMMTRHAVDQVKFRAIAKLREFVKELEERFYE